MIERLTIMFRQTRDSEPVKIYVTGLREGTLVEYYHPITGKYTREHIPDSLY